VVWIKVAQVYVQRISVSAVLEIRD